MKLEYIKKFKETQFGVDIDTHNIKTNKRTVERINKVGHLISKLRSKNGYHYRCKLDKQVDFIRYIELRDFCGDDPLRILKDIKKIFKGAREYDLLFTKKWKGWK